MYSWYVKRAGFLRDELAVEAAERLKTCENLLDAYAQRVSVAYDENR
jgi:hypothetical protein